ncbi:MAG: motility protein A [Lachnospiraceae bacterium]|nr:motility protein A [Lachnospiraceae bacterium]
MDIATLIGVVLCLILMLFGIVFDASVGINFGALGSFVDIPSVLITVGGSMMCVFASKSIEDFIAGLTAYTQIIKQPTNDTGAVIQQIIQLSNTARKEGLLALEEQARSMEDQFMQKGLLLIVDGTEPELVKSVLEAEIDATSSRHNSRIAVWEDWAAQGPAWGMIGTLIGLVNMLQNMDDPSAIGPAMAVALLTTFYGSLIANWICFPASTKLKKRNDDEYTLRSIVIEGLLSIQAGENPRVTEEKLKSFLAPKQREAYEAANAGSGGGGE